MPALPSILCAALLALTPARAFPAGPGKPDARAEILEAIDSIRGIRLDGLDAGQKDALADRLNEAWEVFFEREAIAGEVVREVLESESEDSFLIIDLAAFLLVLHEGDAAHFEELTGYLAKADPEAYSRSFFEITSYMASRRCEACLPAVLRILEVRDLDGYIRDHALPVNTVLGLVFTLAQYGDAILPELLSRLDSDDCTVRGNAAMAIGNLLPAKTPERLGRIAVDDSCSYARAGAWTALLQLREPGVELLVDRRLAAGPIEDAEEREIVASLLAASRTRSARRKLEPLLESLGAESAKRVRDLQKDGLVGSRGSPGSAGAAARRRIVGELKKAAREGRYEGPTDAKEIFAALTPEDLPLLHRARAAVLARLSDECLYEWYPLTAAAGALRADGR